METQLNSLTNEPFELMEQYDDNAILEEIKGRATEKLVYEFRQGGQLVTGLSIHGVRETVRRMNERGMAEIAISETPPFVQETDEYYRVMVYARDAKNGGGNWGVKQESKTVVTREGEIKPDKFALEKALSKAQRNALFGLIPAWFVKEIINAARQPVQRSGTPSPTQAPRQSPPPETPSAGQLGQGSLPRAEGVVVHVPSQVTNGAPTRESFFAYAKEIGKSKEAAKIATDRTVGKTTDWAMALAELKEITAP